MTTPTIAKIFSFTITDINRGTSWSYRMSNLGDRDDAAAYAARIQRYDARQGRNTTVTFEEVAA